VKRDSRTGEAPDTIGVTLEVRATPKAASNSIKGFRNGALLVHITAAPDKNKANEEIIKLLSNLLNIPKSAIAILRGHTSRNKTLSLDGINLSDIERIVENL